MGFQDVRSLVIEALQSGQFQHEDREDQQEKNLLSAQKVPVNFVVRLLMRCSGEQYETRIHHSDTSLLCHIFKPEMQGDRWYIKVFFRRSVVVFISVHR